MDDFKWFIGFLLIFLFIWIGTKNTELRRAPRTATSTPKAQVAPPKQQTAPKPSKTPSTQNTSSPFYPPAGTVISNTVVEPTDPSVSPLRGKLSIGSVSLGAFDREYVIIQASKNNTTDVQITGLTIRSGVSLNGQTIGTGWPLYFPGVHSGTETIFLRPGGRAYLLSGRSPLGASYPEQGSFQLNRCTGYFEQGLDFYPGLPRSCPQVSQDPSLPHSDISDACYDYLKTLRRCVTPSTIPESIKNDGVCQSYVFNKVNYNQCVSNYKDEPNFFTGEWRVYLGRSSELWRNRDEIIELVDQNGLLIDTRD